ncbi:MAG: xanthine dehydrogenase family protein subunit M [Desulfobulbus sp.]|jgi:xanthine dehydrogenase YagS FAD-binding subunit|uniref:FAD binding domain-containing protein n=1 Tax=Desulfobulbus sp. TaxID=895 RepID=UPI00284F35C8|nr:xanthine dehydrogenase family protein subunit M [Desulfobulbus sp.]MDR2549766.1 xanthine dehydrogenase family protein subunit M [Desulfobulbus sp.]
MAIIRDGMPPFDLFRPTSVDDALALAGRFGADAWILAGGFDSLERFKDRLKRPKAVIDLGGIGELRGVRRDGGDLVIGAMTTLAEVSRHPDICERFGLLAEAAAAVASPQIRNQGTLGGNIAQDTRCWYYRGGWTCYRAGGGTCFAGESPQGQNREHAIFGAEGCVAVNPSDTAPALVALEARLVIENHKGGREIAAEDFFVGPDKDITRLNILAPGELLTAIRLPATWSGATFYFEKVSDRPVWDFSLVNIATAMRLRKDRIEQVRLVLGAVAARPWRLSEVEAAIMGCDRNAAAEAAPRLAAKGAAVLPHNGYKAVLAANLAKRALLGNKDA